MADGLAAHLASKAAATASTAREDYLTVRRPTAGPAFPLLGGQGEGGAAVAAPKDHEVLGPGDALGVAGDDRYEGAVGRAMHLVARPRRRDVVEGDLVVDVVLA